jgi:tRNA(Ile)-lysidine synthetase-like protein
MLELGSADAYAYLRARSISWREDASNADTACDRNYVRNVLLPAIESRFPDCRDAIVRLSFNAADSGSLLDRLLGATYGELCLTEGESAIVPLDRLGGDDSLTRHALMSALRGIGVFPKSSMLAEAMRRLHLTRKSHVELYAGQGIAIRKTLREGRPVIEIGKGPARRNSVREWSVRLTRSELERGAVARLEEAGLTVNASYISGIPGREELTSSDRIFVDIKGEIDYIVIRGRMPGDRMALDGATRKIKEMFIDKKLDPYDKHRVPVLVAGSAIAATMEGFVTGRSNTVADGFRIGKLPEKILAIQKVCE